MRIILLALALSTPVLADEAQTPRELALEQRHIAELNAELNCTARYLEAIDEIKRLHAQLGK